MTGLRGRVSVAITLSLLVVAGLLGPASALAAPIDTSGVTFRAFRSFDLIYGLSYGGPATSTSASAGRSRWAHSNTSSSSGTRR